MLKAVEFCDAGENHELSESPPPLASAYVHPEKYSEFHCSLDAKKNCVQI